jgi:ribosomal protein S18 acetylase RimI-like enzyme
MGANGVTLNVLRVEAGADKALAPQVFPGTAIEILQSGSDWGAFQPSFDDFVSAAECPSYKRLRMDCRYRLAEESDLAALVVMMRLLREEDGEPDQPAFDADAARATVQTLVTNSSLGQVWLVCVSEEIVGYVVLTFGYSLEFGGRDAYVDELFIAPTHRRRGLASRALGFAESVLSALGIRAVHLEVKRGNESARRLYLSAGFEDLGRQFLTKRINGRPDSGW